MRALHGISISPGYAHGFATVHHPPSFDNIPKYTVSEDDIDKELARMSLALQRSEEEICAVREYISKDIGEQEAAIFDAHLLFLLDDTFRQALFHSIEKRRINCEQAIHLELVKFNKKMTLLSSAYMHERMVDINDVGLRLLRNLRHNMPDHPLAHLADDTIIVAKELLPSESVNMDRHKIVGIITEHGGSTSHTAILARAMNIPCIVGLPELTDRIADGDPILIDGTKARVTIKPSDWQKQQFRRSEQIYHDSMEYLALKEEKECCLKGGTPIQLTANVNSLEDLPLVAQHNLEGAGLFRTELVFLGSTQLPGLAKQHRVYREAAQQVAPHPMIIRTFDFCADKHPDYLDKKLLSSGLRGVGWALSEKRMLTTQLHAILRAYQEYPNIRILLPMVTNRRQVLDVKTMIAEIAEKDHLKIPPIGAMIETPLAVFSLQDMLPEIEFSSLGCNDLAQYMLGIERELNTNNLHDWVLEPALLRTFESVFSRANEHKHAVSVCGLAASDPMLSSILVGLGARALSVDPACSPQVRYTLRHLGIRDAKKLANLALSGEPAEKIGKAFKEQLPDAPIALQC